MTLSLDSLGDALGAHGLLLRGGFAPEPEDGLGAARTVLLVGNAGPALWEAFAPFRDGGPHPLDRWTRAVVGAVAARFGLAVLYPFERPFRPFQRWAMRAEGLAPSPLGLLVHPEYGLWHAWRAALLSPEAVLLPAPEPRPHPCDACPDRPCLSACPVGAFATGGYDVPACAGFLASAAGTTCLTGGCRARDACPVGRDRRYPAEEVRFHMAAFAEGLTAGTPRPCPSRSSDSPAPP